MNQSKLINTLKLLSKKEMKLLEDFVQSPIHNKNEDVIRLFNYLKQNLYRKRNQLSQENISTHLFGKKDADLQPLHLINSYLMKVVEAFLSWQEWQASKDNQQIALLKTYNDRRAESNFIGIFKQIQKRHNSQQIRNANFHQHQFAMQYHYYTFTVNQGRKRERSLLAAAESLDIYYCVERLRIACFQLMNQAIYDQQYQVGMLDTVLDFVKQDEHLAIPAIAIYYYTYNALAFPTNENYFVELKKLMKKQTHCFETIDLKDIYLLAINYCIRRINNAETKFLSEVFELYKAGLDNKVFLENGVLSRWTYNNIIIAGLKLKAFDWVEQFIYDYKKFLLSENQESSFSFNLAKFYFEKRDYQKAMPLLLKMEHDDFLHNMLAKTTLAKMYYDLKELDALENLLNSMKVYIQRRKAIGYHKENYRNFLRVMKKLMYLNFAEKKKINELRSVIKSIPVLTEKNWFLEKLQNTKNHHS